MPQVDHQRYKHVKKLNLSATNSLSQGGNFYHRGLERTRLIKMSATPNTFRPLLGIRNSDRMWHVCPGLVAIFSACGSTSADSGVRHEFSMLDEDICGGSRGWSSSRKGAGGCALRHRSCAWRAYHVPCTSIHRDCARHSRTIHSRKNKLKTN